MRPRQGEQQGRGMEEWTSTACPELQVEGTYRILGT